MAQERHAFDKRGGQVVWLVHGLSDRASWLLMKMSRKRFACAWLYNSVSLEESMAVSGQTGAASLGSHML